MKYFKIIKPAGMSIVWAWIRTMVFKIADLIHRRFKRVPETEPHVPTPLERELAKRIQKRQARMGRGVDTRRGGPNMPRRQPCPSCHRSAKRKRKTMGGAYYKCREHGEFFVRAPELL